MAIRNVKTTINDLKRRSRPKEIKLNKNHIRIRKHIRFNEGNEHI